MRDNDDSLTIQLPNGKRESISLSLFTCRALRRTVATEMKRKEHLQNIKLSMKFICFCRHSHKIAQIISIIGLTVAAFERERARALRSPTDLKVSENICRQATCICIQQLIGSISCKCCHVVINLSCPTVAQKRYHLLHSQLKNHRQALLIVVEQGN